MSQIDKSLDESSLTLCANSAQTFRAIILPLLRPAILAALVYSFVRAMTAISAVIFLVSAEYDMATAYIIGRVENNNCGLAIACRAMLPSRDLPVGPAELALCPSRVRIEAAGHVDAIPARIAKATYVGSHMEYSVEAEFGTVFSVSNQVRTPHERGADVSIAFSADDAVLLPNPRGL